MEKSSALWEQGFLGQGVRIGHLDTGIDPHHLTGKLADFRYFDRHGYPQPTVAASDETGHGTQIADLIWQVAPQATLISAAVLESGHIVVRAIRGFVWLLAQRVDVICMAFGFAAGNPIFRPLLLAAEAAGITVVCPIGNRGAGYCLAPGDMPEVISVGAVDNAGRVPRFSGSAVDTWGRITKPDVLASGGDLAVSVAHPRTGSKLMQGTSAACAVVAGAVGLLRQAVPDAKPQAIKQALIATAQPLATEDQRRSVAGCIHLPAALAHLRTNKVLPPGSSSQRHAFFVDPQLVQDLQFVSTDSHLRMVMHLAPGAFANLTKSDNVRLIYSALDHQMVVADVPSPLLHRWIESAEAGILALSSPRAVRQLG